MPREAHSKVANEILLTYKTNAQDHWVLYKQGFLSKWLPQT